MTVLLTPRRSLACITLSLAALGALAGCNRTPQPEVPATPSPTTTPSTTPSTPSTTGSTSGTMSDSSASSPSAMPPASAASQ